MLPLEGALGVIYGDPPLTPVVSTRSAPPPRTGQASVAAWRVQGHKPCMVMQDQP